MRARSRICTYPSPCLTACRCLSLPVTCRQGGTHMRCFLVCSGCWHRTHNGDLPAAASLLDSDAAELVALIKADKNWTEYLSCSAEEDKQLKGSLEHIVATLDPSAVPPPLPYDPASIEALIAVRVHGEAARCLLNALCSTLASIACASSHTPATCQSMAHSMCPLHAPARSVFPSFYGSACRSRAMRRCRASRSWQ